MGLKDFFISVLLIGLFFIAMVSFGANLASDNNADQSILDNERIASTFGNMTTELFQAYDDTNDSRTSFERDEIKADSDNLIITSIKGVGTVVGGSLSGVFNLVFGLSSNILSIPNVVLATITAIFTITIVFFAWRAYRAGS